MPDCATLVDLYNLLFITLNYLKLKIMKITLKNVRISYPDIFSPGKKFGKFGAQFRFDEASGVKEQLEAAIDEQGVLAFAARWPAVKKSLSQKGKLFRINEGADKGYEDKYFISVHNALRPMVVGRNAEPIAEEDRVIYPGCRVDVRLDISAYKHDEYGDVVSVKFLGVQFRGDDTPLTEGVKADITDFEPIADGTDADDLT